MPNTKKPHNHYQVGLGHDMLARSRVIFLILIILTLATSGLAVFAGFKTGSIQRNIIEPSKKIAGAIGDAMKESTKSATPKYTNTVNFYMATSSATINIKTNTTVNPTSTPIAQPTKKNTTTSVVSTPKPTVSNTQSYDDAIKAQNEWWAKVQAENAQKSLQSQQDLETFRQNSATKMEQFKQQAQDGLAKFNQENAAKMEEFKKNNGF